MEYSIGNLHHSFNSANMLLRHTYLVHLWWICVLFKLLHLHYINRYLTSNLNLGMCILEIVGSIIYLAPLFALLILGLRDGQSSCPFTYILPMTCVNLKIAWSMLCCVALILTSQIMKYSILHVCSTTFFDMCGFCWSKQLAICYRI